MFSLRMVSGADMVLWYIIPRRFSLLQPRRVTRYFSTVFYRAPHVATSFSHHNTHVTKRHKTEGQHTQAARWTGWRYWFAIWKPLPLSVGLAVLAILQWRRIIRRNRDEQQTEQVATKWEMTCYQYAPLRVISRAWGWIAETQLPESVRPWLYQRYAQTFGCNLDEAASDDLTSYKSLAEFFCRELRDGVRPIHASSVVSPADGQVLCLGRVTKGRVEQVKGVNYSLHSFLGDNSWQENNTQMSDYFKPEDCIETIDGSSRLQHTDYQHSLLENKDTCLYQCVVYLAPGDYHRFHSPVEWQVKFRRHFQGELLSVNPRIAKWIPELFTLNERAVYIGRWKHGFFSLTAVGATNVGSIRVYCDQSLATNERRWRPREHHRDLRLDASLSPGDIFGEFRLGSTVVLVFEAPKDFAFNISPGQSIRVGEGLTKDV